MKKYLVTGAMGFVGSHWCEYLLKKGDFVYGIDLAPRYPKLLEYNNFTYIQDTIKDYNLLRTLVNHVDCVCHFAGIANPEQYVSSPRKVIDLTAIAGTQIIDMCRVTGKLFFLTSTSEIYGKSLKVPFKEDDDRVLGSTMTKRWCYSTSKALLEHYLDACGYSKELDYIIVRLFNVYGPRLEGRVVANLFGNIQNNEDLILHGDGAQTRSFTYIDDVTQAFYDLITNKKCYNNVFNIGNPRETSMNELAKIMLKVSKSKSKIKYMKHKHFYGDSYEDINRRVPDISKIRKFIGWEPKISLEDGIAATYQYIKSEKGGAPCKKEKM